jgi:alcohol dehydrogenase, propanol-preferring
MQLLRALSPATVIATDVAADKLELAKEAGADHTLPADQDPAERIRQLSGGRGAALVLDCVGADATMGLAAAAAQVDSDVTIIGLAGGTLPVRFGALPWEAAVTMPYWGHPQRADRGGRPRPGRQDPATCRDLPARRRLGGVSASS